MQVLAPRITVSLNENWRSRRFWIKFKLANGYSPQGIFTDFYIKVARQHEVSNNNRQSVEIQSAFRALVKNDLDSIQLVASLVLFRYNIPALLPDVKRRGVARFEREEKRTY